MCGLGARPCPCGLGLGLHKHQPEPGAELCCGGGGASSTKSQSAEGWSAVGLGLGGGRKLEQACWRSHSAEDWWLASQAERVGGGQWALLSGLWLGCAVPHVLRCLLAPGCLSLGAGGRAG